MNFETKTENAHFDGVFDLDPKEVFEKQDQVCLIDVRQPDEFTSPLGHIPGSKLIVLDTLPQHLKDLPKDKPVIFICHSGGRSSRASAFALSEGFTQVYNMKGGMLLWNQLQLPTEN